MHDLQTDQNHQRAERVVRRSTRPHHQLGRWNMNKILVTFAVALALTGCAKQPIVGQPTVAVQPTAVELDDAKELADNLARQKVARAFAATHTAKEVAAAWCTERDQPLDQCALYAQYVKPVAVSHITVTGHYRADGMYIYDRIGDRAPTAPNQNQDTRPQCVMLSNLMKRYADAGMSRQMDTIRGNMDQQGCR